jgi:hypothetical protein
LACGGFGLGQWLLSLLTRKIVKEVDVISRLEQAMLWSIEHEPV